MMGKTVPSLAKGRTTNLSIILNQIENLHIVTKLKM